MTRSRVLIAYASNVGLDKQISPKQYTSVHLSLSFSIFNGVGLQESSQQQYHTNCESECATAPKLDVGCNGNTHLGF